MLAIGHRGAAAHHPENTLVSFRGALAAGADGVELDTHVTRDGVAVVFHDDTLRRLTGEPGRIASRTFAQLAAMRVRGERIPRLSEVLRLIGSRAIVQIEVKRGVPLAPVIRSLKSAGGAGRIVLASFSPAAVREAARLAPHVPRMLIAERPRMRDPVKAARALLRRMAAVGASGISVDHRAITQRGFVETIHAHGVNLWCWTVNKPADIGRLARWGVDAVISDDPAAVLRAANRRD